MFTASLHSALYWIRDRLVTGLVRTRVHPNTLTLLGFLLNFPVAVLIATGHLYAAVGVFVVASFFDVLDGALAKAAGKATKFGGFLDSTIDRLSDMLLFGGVAAYFHFQYQDHVLTLLTLLALAFSLMISYTRARAECEIPECQAGIAERPERIIILIAACLLESLPAGVFSLLLLTALTFLTRIVYTWYAAAQKPYPAVWKWLLLDFTRGSRSYDTVMLIVLAFLIAGRFVLRPPVFP